MPVPPWDSYAQHSSPPITPRRTSTAAPPAGYNATTFQNDIALLLLDKAVSRTPSVLPPATRECAVVVVVVVVELLLLLCCCCRCRSAIAAARACRLIARLHPPSLPHPITPRQAKHALPCRHLRDCGGLG